jgi:hypothetical protein
MKRLIPFLILAVLCVAPVFGAITYDRNYYVRNKSYLGSGNANDPLYNLWGTLEGLYEGSSNFDSIRLLESTGATYWTKLQAGNQSANLTLTLPTAYAGVSGYVLSSTDAGVLSWVANGGTFTGGNITSDVTLNADGVDIQGTTTTAHTFALKAYDVDGAAYVDILRMTNGNTAAVVLGAPTVQFSVASTGLDISTAGAISNATTITGTGLITGGGWSGTGNFLQGDGTGTAAFSTSSWDLTTGGALSGITTFSLSDDITMANGKGVKGSTTNAQTVGLYGYDVDGTAYVGAVVVTNGNTPATVLGNSNGTTEITSSDWAISTTGAMTGIGAITTDGTLTYNAAAMTVYANEATTWTHGTNGGADDWTFALTGATDSSIIVSSTGTGTDAISLQASAGGVDVDAAAAQDLNLAAGQVAIVSKDDAASAISLTANIGTSETIVVTNTQGTGESAITLVSTAGGVNVDAAAAKDLDLAGGQVKLVSKDNAAGAISLTANIGASETILVTNSQGTDEASINVTSTAGGVNVDAAAAKNIAIDGGQVLIGSKDDAASAIALTTNVGTSETIVVTNTQGTAAGAIDLTATAGGVTLAAAAANKGITLTGEVYVKKGGDIASPAGGELDLTNGVYFDITGVNNITSIAAADSTAGRMIVLQFDGILTFTDGGNLKLAGNFVTSQDDTITLICDGTNWHEMCRSAN